MPRKKPKQELSDRGEPTLIDWANGLTFVIIEDMMIGRLPHKEKERCEECGASRGKLHIMPCKLELSPCKVQEHTTLWECSCEYHKED